MTNKELDKCIIDFLDGDESSFDLIYHETKKSVYLSIYTIIKNQDTIEDLMQDTYMKAINALNYYKIGTNFKAWISRIAETTPLTILNAKIERNNWCCWEAWYIWQYLGKLLSWFCYAQFNWNGKRYNNLSSYIRFEI